jgi:hypothetical protein
VSNVEPYIRHGAAFISLPKGEKLDVDINRAKEH